MFHLYEYNLVLIIKGENYLDSNNWYNFFWKSYYRMNYTSRVLWPKRALHLCCSIDLIS